MEATKCREPLVEGKQSDQKTSLKPKGILAIMTCLQIEHNRSRPYYFKLDE